MHSLGLYDDPTVFVEFDGKSFILKELVSPDLESALTVHLLGAYIGKIITFTLITIPQVDSYRPAFKLPSKWVYTQR